MCGMVFLNDVLEPGYPFAKELGTPCDLEAAGVELVDIDMEYYNDCWCCNDPEPSLIAAGYTVVHDKVWSDIIGEKEPL